MSTDGRNTSTDVVVQRMVDYACPYCGFTAGVRPGSRARSSNDDTVRCLSCARWARFSCAVVKGDGHDGV